MLKEIKNQAAAIATELIDAAQLRSGQIVVVGCSSSEVGGHQIGSDSSPEIGRALFEALHAVFSEKGIYLAAQCCEHLNRAIIIEAEAATGLEIVNVVPKPKAGGSFATAAYKGFHHPVALEEIKADAGIDIGNTLIGMHLKKVAVPIRLTHGRIGEAPITAARTRPKYIGGSRAVYDDSLN
ncbi:upf0340 3d-structure ywlg smu.87 stu1894 bt9727 4999 transferase tte0860 spy1898/m5005 spy1614 tt1679 [Trichococcus palustris]|jgi:uncharacterized protein (TIGR01440 family)|uniref:UPF0340 protein Tpal_1673 n=1 Tax=Trichococcus palustris TaxID=140314 RepID=A0A143YNT6_9LACT|nr:upf0340 3d-structure ywlg smu.87 stu1894 bt9727 4999 transferase tte0860 spy1898/m5005 spy1614 tt1679 [Trichococcus palustris]SFK83312.1 TIGR01440 family protein [Trichococcus palustris]